MTFFIAMQNRRAMAKFDNPRTIISESNEFLIVSRSGGCNQFLSVSNAGACTDLEVSAPGGLIPAFGIFATLVLQNTFDGDLFLVERDTSRAPSPSKTTLGGDGYLLLYQSDNQISLTGAVRIQERDDMPEALRQCLPFDEPDPGATLYFNASYLPWEREILPSGFSGRDDISRLAPR
ncbi:hypothetical protein [Sulfitobacter sp. JB4-11]|uniref:hypothetical protein n=1 Tax=Sulfitobacter rhodophyticola TaxID=3238304 RepID=UPI0035186699